MRILLEWLDIYGLTVEFYKRRKYKLVSTTVLCLLLISAYTSYNMRSLTNTFDSVYAPMSQQTTDHTVRDAVNPNSVHHRGKPLFELSARGGQASFASAFSSSSASDQEEFQQARHCLAQAMYFEARSEPLEGWQAVGDVVINRVRDKRYPNTVCDVVFQGEFRRHKCQFSFACDGRSDRAYNQNFGLPPMIWLASCLSKAQIQKLQASPRITMLIMLLQNGHLLWNRSPRLAVISFMSKTRWGISLPP